MKIIQFSAENIKRLKAVSIRPDGSVVRIVGRNAQGKSTILDSILYAIGGGRTLPGEPLRKGTKRGLVTLDLGDLVVKRTFTPGGSQVVIEAKDGARYPSPQTILDKLYTSLAFDPLAFVRQSAKDQLDALKKIVKLDVDVDALDTANARDYERRTEVNRSLKAEEQRLANIDAVIDESIDVTPIDTGALLEQMATASEHNAGVERLRVERQGREALIAKARATATERRAEAARLIALAEDDEQRADEWEAALTAEPAVPALLDVSVLRQEIEAAQGENTIRAQEARRRKERHDVANVVQGLMFESGELTAAMEKRQQEKAAAISRAPMPVTGLSFGDGEVLYDGVPFVQASSAEQLRVSFAIAMAANPRLRVALVRDGSLLDEESMLAIAEMAAEHDFQVWVEVVRSDSPVGILIEDGMVASVDGVPVEQDEPAAAVAGD